MGLGPELVEGSCYMSLELSQAAILDEATNDYKNSVSFSLVEDV